MNKSIFVAMVVTAIPLYGYFAHAARDSQLVGLTIIACWLLTCLALLFTVGILIVQYFKDKAFKQNLKFVSYFFAMGVIGYGGVQKAFFELIAG